MVLRPSSDRVRQTEPTAPTTRPPLSMPPGISTPQPPMSTTPTLPPRDLGMPGQVDLSPTAQQVEGVVDAAQSEANENRALYNEFLAQAGEQFGGLGEPTIIEGRYFYDAAPLGLEYATRRMTVPLGLDPDTGAYQYGEFFELYPELLRSPAAQRRAEAFGGVAVGSRAEPFAGALTPDAAERALNTLSTEELLQVKTGLVQIGALDIDDLGSMTFPDTQSNPRILQGFQRLVAVAQNNNEDWRVFLGRMLNNGDTLAPVSTSASGAGGPAFTFRLTAADDLKAVADRVATRTIGRALSAEEADSFVASYQNMERTYEQQLAYGAGTVEMAPSAEVAAQQQIQQDLSEEYDVYQMGNTLDIFRQIIGGV